MSPCMLSLHLFFGRPLLLLPETFSLSALAQTASVCGCVLASSSGQTTLVLLSRKFSTGSVSHAPLSWCLHFWCGPTRSSLLPISKSSPWLNFVCSNISSLRPNIQNRTSLLVRWLFWRLSFNSTGIFLSHITPDTSFHFIHPILTAYYCWHQPVNIPHWWTVLDGYHYRQWSINTLYGGFYLICGTRCYSFFVPLI